MLRRFYFVLTLLAFVPATNAFQNSDWVKVSPHGGGFRAMMPVKPEEEVKPENDLTLHTFSAQTSKAIYMVSYGDYAPAIKLNVPTELAANRDSFVKGVNATLTGSKNITLDNRPGIEFTAENDQASFKSRVYIFGNRVHQIVVAVFNGKDDSENMARFFSSFAFSAQ